VIQRLRRDAEPSLDRQHRHTENRPGRALRISTNGLNLSRLSAVDAGRSCQVSATDGPMLWLAHQQLKSKSTRLRRQAVEKLRNGMPSAVVPIFVKVLREDPEPAVREAAAQSLGEHPGRESLDALVAALTDPAAEVRVAAVEGLRQLGDAGAAPALAPLLRTPDQAFRARVAQALKLLGWQPDDPELEAVFLVALGDLNRAAILGRAAVAPLAEVLKDAAYQRRVVAVNRMAEIGDTTAVRPLIGALHDADPVVRTAAANALGRLGSPEAVANLLALVRDLDSKVRVAATEALGVLKDPRAIPVLIPLIKDQNWEVRSGAIEALGRIGSQEATAAVVEGLRDADREVREQAASALGVLGDARAVPSLVLATLDAERVVRHAASRALQRLDPYWEQSPAVHDILDQVRPFLRDADYTLRQVAAEILRRCGGERAAPGHQTTMTTTLRKRPKTEEILLDLLGDQDPAVRQAALEGLSRSRGMLTQRRLDPLLADADASVRFRAEQLKESMAAGRTSS